MLFTTTFFDVTCIVLIKIDETQTIRSNGRPVGRPRRTIFLKCDRCQNEFERAFLQNIIDSEYHYCSSLCSNRCEKKKEKTKQTCLTKFGVECASSSSLVKKHIRETMQKKYGVDYACQIKHVFDAAHSQKASFSRHLSKIKNGTYKRSQQEKELFTMLQATTDVSHSFMYGKFSIDMQLKEFNCFVQYDGVHWHGLNCEHPISTISKHWKNIAGRFIRDRELDAKISEQKNRMIRITDVFFKEHKDQIVDIILELVKTEWTGVKFLGEHFAKLNIS